MKSHFYCKTFKTSAGCATAAPSLVLSAAACLMAMATAHAEPEPGYSSVVLEASSARTLHAHRADAQHHAGEFIELMLEYMTLDRTDAPFFYARDRLSDTATPPSATASAVADTMLSADAEVDVIIAEMARAAEDIGMTRSIFAGTDPTARRAATVTARDLAKLALAVAPLMSVNDRLPPTGCRDQFWRALGFTCLVAVERAGGGASLAVLAMRDPHTLAVVILDAPNAAARDAQARLLTQRAFAVLEAQDQELRKIDKILTLTASAQNAPPPRRLRIIIEGEPNDEAEAALTPQPAGSFAVQVGAYPTSQGAESRLAGVVAFKVQGLNTQRARISVGVRDGPSPWRARFIGFGDRSAAHAACSALKAVDGDGACYVAPITPADRTAPPWPGSAD